jgi:NAD(P)H dehydrogenase (quinone)
METLPRETDILIVYYTRYGTLGRLAEEIAAGARAVPRTTVSLLRVEDQPIEELRPGEDEAGMQRRRAVILQRLAAADALIVGAPAYFGSMASPVKRFFEDCVTASVPPMTDRSRPWRQHLFHRKVGGAFTTSATPHGGNEQTLHSILTMLIHLGLILVTPGQGAPILENEAAPYGPTAITGPTGDQLPSPAECAAARAYGALVAEVTAWLRWGRQEWERWRAVAYPSPSPTGDAPPA